MDKRKMILITDYYPYATGETFLENEVTYLAEHFELSILSSDIESPQTRDVPDGVMLYRVEAQQGYGFFEKCKYTLNFLFSWMGIQEVYEILSDRTKIFSRLFTSLYFHVQAESFLNRVNSIEELRPDRDTIVYSYWANYKLLAYAKKREKERFKLVSRFHGYDLYNERFATGRQPFKNQMNDMLDAGLFVSQAGYDYYKSHFKVKDAGILHLFRLGTNEPKHIPEREVGHEFTICSCSNVIPIKRVELIVEALKCLGDYPVRWVHFGDGKSFEQVKQLACDLPVQISYEFRGRVKNEEVLAFYSKHFVDCFITTTQTEGCPVSIMEALSYGIPVIATAVGGIPEMLEGTPNILLPENPEVDAIADAIRRIYHMTTDEIDHIRDSNMNNWRSAFSQEINNGNLIEFLRSI